MQNQRGFIELPVLIAILLGIVVLGGGSYFVMHQNGTSPTQPTTQAIEQTSQISSKSKASRTAVSIQVLSLVSQNKTSLPILTYSIGGQINDNTFINLVNKTSGVKVWGVEDAMSRNTIDLNLLTAIDGSTIKIVEDDYFLLLQDWRSGKTLAESAVFHVAHGANVQTVSLDNRCVKKAIGIGMCMARFKAVEFNLSTKKCEYVDVGGCSVTSPFNETTYSDSNKELNLCQKVCEGKTDFDGSTYSSIANPSVSETDITFTGVIQTIRDLRPVDGSLDIEVNSKWIEVATSGQIAVNAIGSVTDLAIDYSIPIQSNVGKKVEVFATRSNSQDPNHFTIVGNEKYYVKVVK